MYTLFSQSSARTLLLTQAPAAGTALVLAEMFYRFGSFALECMAFLATWGILDLALTAAWRLLPRVSRANDCGSGQG